MATLQTINKENTQSVYGMIFDVNPSTLIVKTNGGSVTVEAQIDTAANEWVLVDTFTADGAYKLEANGCNLRITPLTGAEFAFVRP